MEDVRVMDASVALCRDGLGQHVDNFQVSQILGDEILENLESYFQDNDDRLIISRMVSDSVIRGMVNAVKQEADEKIAQKELEVEKLKHMLHLIHVGADENESLGSALTHHESKSTSHPMMYCNCPDAFVEHDRMKESLGSLRNVAKEQFKKLKKAIDGVRGCSSIRKINSGSELLGLGRFLPEKASERWIDVDEILESLNATFDTVHERVEDMFELSRESLCSWQQEQEFKAEIEGMVIENCIWSLQEGFEERLWDQNVQFGGNENVNWLEKINDISSLRQELDAISKSLSIHESRPLTSLGSLEISGEWSNDKKADHFRSKSLSNSVTSSTFIWEGNGKHEDSNSNIPENSDPAKLKQMSKDELITEMTNMRRYHESKVQEITEKNFRLMREILCMKERGSASPLKKDNELDILKRKIPHFISKLDGILVENKMLCAFSKNAENLGSLKDRLESLLSENRQLRDLLADKEKEVTCLLAQVSDAADKMSQRQLFESKYKEDASATRPILLDEPEFEAEPKLISIHHPTTEEISASMGTPMEGFFDGADVVFEATTSATLTTAQGVPAKAPIPSTESVSIDEGTHTKRAVKDGFSLVVTPSSIPSFTTRGPNADLSSEGSEDVLEDPDDELTMKKMISDSDDEESADHEAEFMETSDYDNEESADHEAEFMETFEEPRVAADTTLPTATSLATPIVPVSAIPTAPVFAILFAPASAILTAPILTGPSPIPTAPPQFEVGSSSATIPDSVSEAAIFFTRFDQPDVNDLDPADFWGSGPPYIDFHGFRVPMDCASHLEAVYSSRGDFMQGFRLGRFAREHFLKLLGSVMNDIEHNFVDTVYTERILQWKAAIQELVNVGFAVEFILEHLHEIARAFFMKKVQPAVDAIDTRIEALRKEVADLEGRREHLLSSIGGSSRFGDQSLISGLR